MFKSFRTRSCKDIILLKCSTQIANKEGDVRFTIIASQDVVSDIKFITAWEKKKLKDLTNEILRRFHFAMEVEK